MAAFTQVGPTTEDGVRTKSHNRRWNQRDQERLKNDIHWPTSVSNIRQGMATASIPSVSEKEPAAAENFRYFFKPSTTSAKSKSSPRTKLVTTTAIDPPMCATKSRSVKRPAANPSPRIDMSQPVCTAACQTGFGSTSHSANVMITRKSNGSAAAAITPFNRVSVFALQIGSDEAEIGARSEEQRCEDGWAHDHVGHRQPPPARFSIDAAHVKVEANARLIQLVGLLGVVGVVAPLANAAFVLRDG